MAFDNRYLTKDNITERRLLICSSLLTIASDFLLASSLAFSKVAVIACTVSKLGTGRAVKKACIK